MTQPVQEPTQGRTDSGQDWRTRQLFRRPSSVGGLQYNIATVYGPHNIGDWLWVTTESSGYPGGMLFESLAGDITIDASTDPADTIFLLGGGQAEGPGGIVGNAGEITFETIGTLGSLDINLVAGASGGLVNMRSAVYAQIQASSQFWIQLESTTDDSTYFQVWDGGGAPGPLFEVRADGTIHGRAAVGAITWDL
jgi:hypothetical protein